MAPVQILAQGHRMVVVALVEAARHQEIAEVVANCNVVGVLAEHAKAHVIKVATAPVSRNVRGLAQ